MVGSGARSDVAGRGQQARQDSRPVQSVVRVELASSSTPTRCRSCRPGRTRSAGTCRPATCPTQPSAPSLRYGNRALPGVGHQLPARRDIVAPRVRRRGAAASRVLPLGLGRQSTARPAGVRRRIGVCDLHHRVVEADPRYRCPGRTGGASWRRAPSPTTAASRVDRPGRCVGRNTSAPGTRSCGAAPGIQRRIGRLLGDGDVTGVGDEFGELGVGHRMPLDREARATVAVCTGASSG